MTLHIDKVQNGVLTLYAVWEENTYTVKYDPNGGVSSTNPIYVVKEGEQITIDDGQNFFFEGHHLLGWSTSATSNTVEYELGKDVLFPIDKVQNGVLTLYAVWEKVDYKITYNANGGQGADFEQTGNHGEKVTISNGDAFTREWYHFLGWSIDPNATAPDAEYTVGKEMSFPVVGMQNNALTLYAVWEKNEYQIEYNANGGQGTELLEHVKEGDNITISDGQLFSYVDHHLLGWSTDPNATQIEYELGKQILFPIDKVQNDKLVLYAVWKENLKTYSIEYNANGGQGTENGHTGIHEGGQVKLSDGGNLSRDKYHLLGWSTDAAATTPEYQLGEEMTLHIDKVQNGVLTLYAVWGENTYTVKYDPNGGVSSTNPIYVVKEGEQITIDDGQNFSFEGHHLLGWSTSATSNTVEYELGKDVLFPIDKVQNGVLTLYAVWKENPTTYTIEYNANGGQGTESSHTGIQEGEHVKLSDGAKFTRDDFYLLGWSTDAAATTPEYQLGEEMTLHIDKVQNGVLTLYAVWEPVKEVYTIRYEPNGGAGEPFEQIVEIGQEVKISSGEEFTKDGHRLIEWSTQARATSYKPGEIYIDLANAGEVLTLYAIWKADPTDEDVPNVPPQEEEGEPNTPPQEEEGEPNTPPQEEEGEPNVPPQKEDTPNIPSEKEDVTNTTNPTAEKTENTSQPVQTGDKWNGFFLVSFLISGGVLGVVIYKRRRA